ncbi:MAG: hypothetical protein Q7T55_05115 [Solirubrobacteraceae bacterium]|nr:hypothetical protein [Solirubrobacteraceae bacterium]
MSKTVPILRAAFAAVPLVAAALALPTGASAAGVALSTAGWNWTNPAPQGNTLSGIQFVGNTGYAYGGGGTILRTTDGGTTWSGLYTGTGQAINSIDLVDENTLVARVGTAKSCGLRLTSDGGATFKRFVFDGNEGVCDTAIRSVDFVSKDVGFVLMADGRILKTADGAASFGGVTKVDGGTNLLFVDGTTGYATTATTLKKTPDGGQTWSDVAPLPAGVTAVRLLSPTTMIGWGKDVYAYSKDAGATWSEPAATPGPVPSPSPEPTPSPSPDPSPSPEVSPSPSPSATPTPSPTPFPGRAPRTIGGITPSSVSCRTELQCAFFGDNQLILTSDGGATFTKATIGNGDVNAVGYAAGGRLVATGKRGVTYLSDNDGATFRRTSSDPVAEEIQSIDTRGAGGPVGITGNGRIARVVGDAWSLLPTLSTGSLTDADFVDDKVGYALGTNGNLQRTQNGGATWTTLDTGTPSASKYIVAFDASTQVLLGNFGVYRASTDGVFEQVSSKNLRKFRIQGVDAKGNRAFVWDDAKKTGGIRATSDAGKSWKVVKLPKGAKSVDEVAAIPSKGLLASIDGKLYRSSTDKGSKWTALPSAGSQVSNLEASSATEFLVVPKGDWDDSVILRTTDAGKSFAAQALSGGGNEISALAADGPGKAFAAVTGGEAPALFSTITGGVRGAASSLSLSRTSKKQKPSSKVAIAGTLPGAKGGEVVRVAVRKVGSASWKSVDAIAGANGGSFTARFKLSKGQYEVVGQWTGDSGRAGAGSSVLKLKIAK